QAASPSPTATPPTMPAAAKGASEAAAKAFVRHWIDVLNYAGPAGDARELEKLSGGKCAACSAITSLIDDVDKAGGYIRGKGWSVKSIKLLGSARQRRIVEAQVDVAPQEIRQEAGGESVHFDGGSRLKTFWVGRSKDAWIVTRLDQPE
ncbi:MAG: DUF6318 family protein, partial [Nocardioidaceae bacterium]